MAELVEGTHGSGGVEDRVDSRDYLWSEVGHGSIPFDWSIGFDVETKLGLKIPVKNQGTSSACGGMAWSYEAEVLEAIATGSFEERSAKFIYAQTYVPQGGSYGRDNAKILENQGVARESVLSSYINNMAPDEPFMTRGQDITPEARANALLARSFPYAQVDGGIDDLARAIRDNNGSVLGLSGQDNGTWLSTFPKPPQTAVWRHFVYAAGGKIINGVKHIKIINSWGPGVGEQGVQWLSEDYINNWVWSKWTHVFNSTVPPPFSHQFNVNLKFGDSGSEIVALQRILQDKGYFPSDIAATGFYGQISASAVLKFRLAKNISSISDPLGRSVGPLTRAALNSL